MPQQVASEVRQVSWVSTRKPLEARTCGAAAKRKLLTQSAQRQRWVRRENQARALLNELRVSLRPQRL